MIEIRGQQAADWQDVYAIRVADPNALPYLRPEAVRDELAKIPPDAWPLVAVARQGDCERVLGRCHLQLGWGRRRHVAMLELEYSPELEQGDLHTLLREAIRVAKDWFNARRLQITRPASDAVAGVLLESLNFKVEARLRRAVRIAGRLDDELLLARLDEGDFPAAGADDEKVEIRNRPRRAPAEITIRGARDDDWQAMHEILAHENAIWGTMQLPYPSADRNRQRFQAPPTDNGWPIVAELDGQVVGNTYLARDTLQRSHVGRVGMTVHHAYQGLGIGSLLMQAAVDLGDNWLGLSRLQLEVYTDNPPAIGLYRKYGFQEEGRCRAYAYRNGRYVDALVMGRLKESSPRDQ